MPFLVLFKRIEIWLLLGVVIAILVFAFSSEESSVEEIVQTEPGSETEVAPEPAPLQVLPEPVVEEPAIEEAPPALIVEDIRTEPTDGGKIIALTLRARSLDGEKIVINDRSLQVSTDTGATVPRFFAPFQNEPVITSEEPTEVEVRYWLATDPSDTVAKTLWLDFQGEKTEAKIPGNG
jgi:hypothetical protein